MGKKLEQDPFTSRMVPGPMLPICPACESQIEIDDLDVDEGDRISCPECGTELQVMGVGPIELDLTSEDEGEEWWEF